MQHNDFTEYKQISLAPSIYCAACPAGGLCGERETAHGCSTWGSPNPNLLHPSKPDWLERIVEVNGFGFQHVCAIDQRIPLLPRYIPRIRINSGGCTGSGILAAALSLREAKALAAKMQARSLSAREILGLPKDSLLIILGFENDEYLEKSWPRPQRRELLEAIRYIQPDLAVAWGYSVWYRHADGWVYPRVENLYSMKRSLVVFEDLQRIGIPAIPHIYWRDSLDLDRWIAWLDQNKVVTTIAVDLQTADSESDWRTALRGLVELHARLPRKLNLLVNGPCIPARIRQLDEIWPGYTLTNFAAYFSAFLRFKAMYGLRARWTDGARYSRQGVFFSAVREYEGLLKEPTGHLQMMVHSDSKDGARRPIEERVGEPSLSVPRYLDYGVVQLTLPEATPTMESPKTGVA